MRCPKQYASISGFSYIEVLIAMAFLSIILLPVFPALNQAQANHRFAVLRRQAQGQAVTLALEVRANPGNASEIIQQIAEDQLIYRVSLIPTSGPNRVYSAGDISKITPSETGGISFQTGFAHLFSDGIFVIAEVFDSHGNLAGMSVAKIN